MKSWFPEKISKIDKLLARQIKKNRRHQLITFTMKEISL